MASLVQYEYLVAVDRYRHFGKAAKACNVSQPTLSMQLQKLEEEFEVTFFDRTKQPILPTPQALPIIEQAKVLLRENEKIKHLVKVNEGELVGDFHLAVIPTVAPYLLHRFVGEFATLHPKLNLTISERTTAEIIESLDRDEIEAGILATPLANLSLDERPLYYEPFFVYTSKNHSLFKLKSVEEDELPAHEIWLLAEGHCLRNQVVRLCSMRKSSAVFKNVKFDSGSLETLIHLINQGHGYTLLPALAADSVITKNGSQLKEFKKMIPAREISMVYQRSQYKQAIIKALIESVRMNLPKSVYLKRQANMNVLQVKQS
jgi:LysR family hydrogen peroxide-inducible transcriptional activator